MGCGFCPSQAISGGKGGRQGSYSFSIQAERLHKLLVLYPQGILQDLPVHALSVKAVFMVDGGRLKQHPVVQTVFVLALLSSPYGRKIFGLVLQALVEVVERVVDPTLDSRGMPLSLQGAHGVHSFDRGGVQGVLIVPIVVLLEPKLVLRLAQLLGHLILDDLGFVNHLLDEVADSGPVVLFQLDVPRPLPRYTLLLPQLNLVKMLLLLLPLLKFK